MQVNFYNTGALRSYSAPTSKTPIFYLHKSQQGQYVRLGRGRYGACFVVGLSEYQREYICQLMRRAKLTPGQCSHVSQALSGAFNVPHWAALPSERFSELVPVAQRLIIKTIERSKEIKAQTLKKEESERQPQKKAGENIARFLSDVYMIRRHLERQRDAIDQLLKRLDAPNEEEQMIKALEALGL